jgi:ribonuclease R
MRKPNKNSKQARYSRPQSGSSSGRATPDRATQTRSDNDNRAVVSRRRTDSFLDELKGDVAAYFELNSPDAFSSEQLLDHFDVTDQRMELIISNLLAELIDEGIVQRLPDGTFRADEQTPVGIEGVVDHVNAKFAFVVPTESTGEKALDLKISADDLAGAIDGDRVRVLPYSDSGYRSKGQRIEGRVTEVLQRGRTELVGRIDLRGTVASVTPDSRKIYDDIAVPLDKIGTARQDDKVIVKLTGYPTGRRNSQLTGEVVTVLGQAGENNTEMHAILAEFGLPNEFPEAVEAEAEAIPTKILVKEIKKRRDMRDVLTFTIDPFDAKDFDDALSVRWLDNGRYEIGIHIADVTHYVKPGSALEEEALKRATSVYLVDRVVPMLPEKLSNGLCSLRPNEDKLTFSAVFELDENANIMAEWFGRTVIHSDRRFAYEEAQAIMNANESADAGDHLDALLLLNRLAYILRDKRFKNGAINFESVEVKFKLDDAGRPLAVVPKVRQDTNKLIEEFMLLANKRVAEHVHNLSKGEDENTMVYRVHEGPNEEKLQQFADFAKRFGYTIKVGDKQLSSSLNSMMTRLEGKPEQNMLQQLAVRTMSKARYSTDDLGHFGLAFKRYSHFTSPIRRYPDMMAHRLLQHYLDGGKAADRDPLEVQCRHASEREKMASDAERASIKYKQVEFMSRMDPEQVFDGIISGVTEFGIFVEIIENSCEGLVRMQDLTDDFYEFDKENYRIVGTRSKRMFTFGDPVQVRVKETNLARRSMDFALAGAKTNTTARRVVEKAVAREPWVMPPGGMAGRVNKSAVKPKAPKTGGRKRS